MRNPFRREKRASESLENPSVELVQALTGHGLSSAGVPVSPESAMRLGDVYACVRAIAEGVGSLPLIAYRRAGDDARERIAPTRGSTAYLLAHPAPTLTPADLWATVVAHLNLRGNAYLVKYRDAGRIVGLGVLTPGRVTVEVRNGEPIYKVARVAGSSISGTFTSADIIHIKGLSLDGVYGLSPIAQTREAIGAGIAVEAYGASFFGNSANPSGILKVAGELSDTAHKRLKDDWEAKHQGAGNANRVAILEAGTEWQATSIVPEDAQFIETQKLSTQKIARIFSVPPWRIGAGAGDSMTYSNVESQDLAFAKHCLSPWLVRIEHALAADPDLFPEDGSEYAEFLIDAMLRADSETRAAVYTKAVWRWMTPNEIRRLENMPPAEDGDKLYPPSKMPNLLEVTK